MLDYREIDELAKSPARCQALAKFLQQTESADRSDWEIDFLEAIAARDQTLTMRQAEKLVEIRNNAIRYRQVSGYTLARLVRESFARRLDLDDEEDVAFIEDLHRSAATALTRPQALRLKRCATALGLLEPHTVWTFAVPALARF